jgi:hypothetical protein
MRVRITVHAGAETRHVFSDLADHGFAALPDAQRKFAVLFTVDDEPVAQLLERLRAKLQIDADVRMVLTARGALLFDDERTSILNDGDDVNLHLSGCAGADAAALTAAW